MDLVRYVKMQLLLYRTKEETQQVRLINFQKKITIGDETISFKLIQMQVSYCCTAYLFQPEVETVFYLDLFIGQSQERRSLNSLNLLHTN